MHQVLGKFQIFPASVRTLKSPTQSNHASRIHVHLVLARKHEIPIIRTLNHIPIHFPKSSRNPPIYAFTRASKKS